MSANLQLRPIAQKVKHLMSTSVDELQSRIRELESENTELKAKLDQTRKRPEKTIKRDKDVLKVLRTIGRPVPNAYIHNTLNIDRRDSYGSLTRLQEYGLVKREGQNYSAITTNEISDDILDYPPSNPESETNLQIRINHNYSDLQRLEGKIDALREEVGYLSKVWGYDRSNDLKEVH